MNARSAAKARAAFERAAAAARRIPKSDPRAEWYIEQAQEGMIALGVVPGARYGWPKNILHWKGIQESILDVCATIPVHFVIADGIMAMEGNGPLNGTARPLGKIVLADDPVAADATCARLMGFEPDRVVHIREGAKFLGNLSPALLDQMGEIPSAPTTPFQVVPEFRHLYAL